MIKKGTRKTKPGSYISIAKVLNSIGVSCDRKTVSRNVDYLIEFGEPIVKVKGVGCYYDLTKKREIATFFEEDEN